MDLKTLNEFKDWEKILYLDEKEVLGKFYKVYEGLNHFKFTDEELLKSYISGENIKKISEDTLALNEKTYLTYNFLRENDDWSKKLLYCKLDIFKKISKIKNNHVCIEDTNMVEILDEIVNEAIRERASDIHIEQRETCGKIRLRVDGFLSDYYSFNLEGFNKLNTRIKVLASMDISNKLLPQDGHIRWKYFKDYYDIRVSTMPTIYGEKIVMRILHKDDDKYALDKLNMTDENLELIKETLYANNGMVLVTGPTGSGKTTTLYSILKYIKNESYNIVTIEDPVEYRVDGVSQTQINRKMGLDFSSGLRAILRQDPDIILVGEIRDSETARLSLRSSITGHLVLSSLHTSTIGGSLLRLQDLGVDKYLILDGIKLIINQRLVRKLCDKCKQEDDLNEGIRKKYGLYSKIYKAKGCEFCKDGYVGRIGVYEVLGLDRNRLKNIEVYDKNLLRDDLIHKINLGETSMDEFYRIIKNR